jgi:long-chain acyl-CoA synthetase
VATKASLLPGRVAARLARQVEVGLAQVDLSVPQYRILMFLDEGAAVASKLADHLAVSRPSVTAVVDGLVARGLVERRHDEQDRRRVGHVLTAEGGRVLEAADREVDARLREIAGYLPDEGEAAAAFDGLDRWRQSLDSYRAAKVAAREGGRR